MDGSLLSFRVLGFDVNVQATFVFLLGFVVLGRVGPQTVDNAIGWLVALPLGILVHELGHAWVARRFRIGVGRIELYGLGGFVTHERTTPARQLAISLAGPFAGFALGAVAMGVGLLLAPVLGDTVWDLIVEPMATVTFFYGLLNLLPAFPLDGGNALRAAIATLASDRMGLTVTATLGLALGAGGVWYGMTSGQVGLAVLAAFLAWQNLQVWQTLRR